MNKSWEGRVEVERRRRRKWESLGSVLEKEKKKKTKWKASIWVNIKI